MNDDKAGIRIERFTWRPEDVVIGEASPSDESTTPPASEHDPERAKTTRR